MIKTQIQLPDELYRAAKALAARKEWSLAEVVRRGLEGLLCLFPEARQDAGQWQLPEPRPLGGDAFFENPDWRFELHQPVPVIREPAASYGKKSRKKTR